jgi:hypothetical protein
MTGEEFRRLALKLFGPERGWQSRCASALGTDRANVSRWISGAVPAVPGPVAAAMNCWNATLKRTGERPEF